MLAAFIVFDAGAAERIHFKNGHTIMAIGVREEGPLVYLTMPDGSEIGFPKQLIKTIESDKKIRNRAPMTTFGGRGPAMAQTNAYQARRRAMGGKQRIAEGVLGPRRNGQPNTVGFSYRGSGYGSVRDPNRARPGVNIVTAMSGSTGGQALARGGIIEGQDARTAAQQTPTGRDEKGRFPLATTGRPADPNKDRR